MGKTKGSITSQRNKRMKFDDWNNWNVRGGRKKNSKRNPSAEHWS
jgi:hypothetical protein